MIVHAPLAAVLALVIARDDLERSSVADPESPNDARSYASTMPCRDKAGVAQSAIRLREEASGAPGELTDSSSSNPANEEAP